MNRRAAMLGTGAAALAGWAGGARAAPRPRFGLADITVMKELLRDYAGTLQQVAAMGYQVMGFRLAGYAGPAVAEPTPADKARLVRGAGLELGVVRLGVRNPDFDRDLGQAADIGAKVVALTTAAPYIAGPKLFETTRAAFDAWLPKLANLGEMAHKRGLTLVYHNHWYDLLPLGGERPLDVMARTIPPEILSFEIDLAWTWYAGVAPLDLLRQLGPRVVSMHWKDIDRSRGKSITDHAVAPGSGEMDYPALLPHVVRATRATGYVEVDSPDDGLAAAHQGAEVIRHALAGRH
ncbi:MAG: sugar phosphate isomerase/epimerase [Novosphingobium sp.]